MMDDEWREGGREGGSGREYGRGGGGEEHNGDVELDGHRTCRRSDGRTEGLRDRRRDHTRALMQSCRRGKSTNHD